MPTTSKPKPRKPSKEFGDAAVSLAIEKWGNQAAVLAKMGYEADSKNETLRRLKKGDGSDTSARALYDALKRSGADVSKLPPIYPDDVDNTDKEAWRREWAWIGEMLHEHAPGIYEQNVDRLRDLARALARQVGNESVMFRPT